MSHDSTGAGTLVPLVAWQSVLEAGQIKPANPTDYIDHQCKLNLVGCCLRYPQAVLSIDIYNVVDQG